ncbi:ATP-binding protein [Deminuibacter soli]|uniref:AAA family ATPase n=1 Tax=Deminuibacter soli TaxID=2291815 RepID=A0A3E1NQE0_9BACT|nr:SbcC/MukB-like Walker B domain-containing protein [Deminuibacter soli]RFM30146.1 hypothetical protein DXN05_04010 [Deminuibacter soli]
MQLNVFSTDNHKSGFRLQYMEVFNWGTFDEIVHRIKPMGETSLLTGANGSGKTTFVDALLTLIVPEKKYRFYNQSSGSEKKGDRTEESYVQGGYGSVNSESTGSTKTLYLRENRDEVYSILLANFANEAEQTATLFQVRYFVNGDMKKVFGIAHKPLRIEDDFKPFDLGSWKKNIDKRYNTGSRKQVEWFNAASNYAQRMTEVLGMQSIQALSLFNQTVGIKVLGNLDEFIRMHMLEPRNMEEQFLDLKKHLGTLLDAQRNIEKAEAQIHLLQPLQQQYETYTLHQQQLVQAKQELDTVLVWNSYTKHHLLKQAVQEAEHDLVALQQKLETGKAAISTLLEQERVTRNQLEQNKAGQRLAQLEKDLDDAKGKLKQTETNATQFTEWCNALHLQENGISDEASYKRVKTEAHRAKLRIDRESRLNEDDEFEAKNVQRTVGSSKTQLEAELNILLQSKHNIPGHLVTLRKSLCEALKLDTDDLPFAGELMQVKTTDLQWQPALEKLLHGFALRLLIPDKHYKKVNRYVNNTDLRARLVYYRVNDSALQQYADDDTVFHKLEFHPDHPLTEWVEQQVIQQFNYVCLDDERTLERYDKAITLHGLIKNRDRHEKDDRPQRGDAGNYVMGWDNERKKESLIRKRHLLADELATAEETLQRCKRKAERLRNEIYAHTRIEQQESFAEINIAGAQRSIRTIEEQLQQLRQSSNQLLELTKQLDDLLLTRQQLEFEREDLLGKKRVEEDRIAHMRMQLQQLQELLQHIREHEKDQLLQFQQQYADLVGTVTLDTIDAVYQHTREKTSGTINRLQDAVHREETGLNKAIGRIKNPAADILQRFPDWLGDVQLLGDDASNTIEYMEWLAKLENDNLPKYKKDFERYLHETMVYKMGELSEQLENWERNISNSVTKLNQSLAGINFNRLPDTYIQLGKRAVTDTSIKEFRNRLLESLPQAVNWQQSSFEDKASHFRQKVQPLIDSLNENEAYRARVMDVRNWFEFWADEKFRNTDELKKTYRQMGQLSGGEKAQLTYTILCSAIAYQFGITREGSNSKSLRFIAVDESFSNQDEEKATYLMELCKQLHLQLLVVTPSDKIQIVQDFIAYVHLVQRVKNRESILYNMTMKELKEKIAEPA